jgi:hypothetical protein
MIKSIFLTAALLAPSLAYGQNPSADLPVQVVSAGSDPTVPAPAVAAGFTDHVLSADFSQSSYSDITTWVNGCGASSTPPFWWFGYWGESGQQPHQGAPCSRIIMENDPSIGKQVLHLQYLSSDSAVGSNPNNQILTLTWPAPPFNGPPVNYLPIEYYMEITFRQSEAGLTQSHQINNQRFYLGPSGFNSPSCYFGPDNFEILTNSNSDSGWVYGDCAGFGPATSDCVSTGQQWCGTPPEGLAKDLTQYHTCGTLFTSDGTTQMYMCAFVDGVNTTNGCPGPYRPAFTAPLANHQYIMINGRGTDSLDRANGSVTVNEDIYIQRIDIWVCPGSFMTSQGCTATLVNHWPFP